MDRAVPFSPGGIVAASVLIRQHSTFAGPCTITCGALGPSCLSGWYSSLKLSNFFRKPYTFLYKMTGTHRVITNRHLNVQRRAVAHLRALGLRLKVPAPCDRGHSCCSSQRRLPFQRLSQDFPRCACLSRMNTVPILPLPRSPKETPVTLLQRPFASKIARDPMSCGDGILLCLLSPSPPCASAVSHGVFSSVTRPRKFPRSRLLILGRLSFLSPMCVPLAHRNDGSHNGTDGTAPRSRSVSCR